MTSGDVEVQGPGLLEQEARLVLLLEDRHSEVEKREAGAWRCGVWLDGLQGAAPVTKRGSTVLAWRDETSRSVEGRCCSGSRSARRGRCTTQVMAWWSKGWLQWPCYRAGGGSGARSRHRGVDGLCGFGVVMRGPARQEQERWDEAGATGASVAGFRV